MPDGAIKLFQVPPFSMCRIMFANTLSTTYRVIYEQDNQTFVYWKLLKFGSDRHDNLQVWWDQKLRFQYDRLGFRFLNSTTFQYLNDYASSPADSEDARISDYYAND